MKKILFPCAALLLGATTALFAQNTAPSTPPEPPPPPHRGPPLLLLALDTDHDGQLSAAEIAQAATALKAFDRNGDGVLTADELHPPRPGDKPDHDGPPPLPHP